MPNVKKISLFYTATAQTVYCIVRRATDSYRLDDADGAFASAPADPYLSLTEDSVIKGLYETSESRTVWTDSTYEVFIYKQTGGSPAPASDTMMGSLQLLVVNDTKMVLWQAPS